MKIPVYLAIVIGIICFFDSDAYAQNDVQQVGTVGAKAVEVLVYAGSIINDPEMPPRPSRRVRSRRSSRSKALFFASIGTLAGGLLVLSLTGFWAIAEGSRVSQNKEYFALFLGTAGALLVTSIILRVIVSHRKSGRRKRRIAASPWVAPQSGGMGIVAVW